MLGNRPRPARPSPAAAPPPGPPAGRRSRAPASRGTSPPPGRRTWTTFPCAAAGAPDGAGVGNGDRRSVDSLFRMFLSFRPPLSGLNGQHWGKRRHTLTVGPPARAGRVAGRGRAAGHSPFRELIPTRRKRGGGLRGGCGGGGDAGAETSRAAASTRSAGREEAGTAPAPPPPPLQQGPSKTRPWPAPPPPRPHPPAPGVGTPESRAPRPRPTHLCRGGRRPRPRWPSASPTPARGPGLRLLRSCGWPRPPASPGHRTRGTLPPRRGLSPPHPGRSRSPALHAPFLGRRLRGSRTTSLPAASSLPLLLYILASP